MNAIVACSNKDRIAKIWVIPEPCTSVVFDVEKVVAPIVVDDTTSSQTAFPRLGNVQRAWMFLPVNKVSGADMPPGKALHSPFAPAVTAIRQKEDVKLSVVRKGHTIADKRIVSPGSPILRDLFRRSEDLHVTLVCLF